MITIVIVVVVVVVVYSAAPPSYDEVISSPNELPQVEPSSPATHRSSLQETRFTDPNRIVNRGTLPPPIDASPTSPVVSTGIHNNSHMCLLLRYYSRFWWQTKRCTTLHII